MKQITRIEAENLFKKLKVVSTNIEQNQEEMQIIMNLSNNCAFMLKYNLHDHEKKYFLGHLK